MTRKDIPGSRVWKFFAITFTNIFFFPSRVFRTLSTEWGEMVLPAQIISLSHFSSSASYTALAAWFEPPMPTTTRHPSCLLTLSAREMYLSSHSSPAHSDTVCQPRESWYFSSPSATRARKGRLFFTLSSKEGVIKELSSITEKSTRDMDPPLIK